MIKAAENTIPTRETTMRKDDMSMESLRLEDRAILIKQNKLEEANLTTKLLTRQRKKDKKTSSNRSIKQTHRHKRQMVRTKTTKKRISSNTICNKR